MFAPYLFFDGDCAAAFDFYRDVFGGEIASRATYAEAPAEMNVAPEYQGRIMHITLTSAGASLLGSDVIPDDDNYGTLAKDSGIFIMHEPKSREDADRIFARLTDGGEVKMPMQEMFWGAYFGTCQDPHGIKWMIHHFPENK